MSGTLPCSFPILLFYYLKYISYIFFLRSVALHFNVYKNKTKWFAYYNRGNTAHQNQARCITIRHFLFWVQERPRFDTDQEKLVGTYGPELSQLLLAACETLFPRPIALRTEVLQKATALSRPIALAAAKVETKAPRILGR